MRRHSLTPWRGPPFETQSLVQPALIDGDASCAPFDRTIDNQVARLRKNVERNAAHPALIPTMRGIGYSFTCDVRMIDPPIG